MAEPIDEREKNCLILHLDRLHTTDMGLERLKRNVCPEARDGIGWCVEKIKDPGSTVVRRGKNWYVRAGDCEITVNAGSFTVITAHRLRKPLDTSF